MFKVSKGLVALSPLMVFIGLYLVLGLVSGDFYKVPMTVVFLFASVYAIALHGGMPLKQRIDTYSRGAGSADLLLMLWIYLLAGAFAEAAKEMGAIDSTVGLTLQLLPAQVILPGMFLAACFISLSIGTSVGTVVALVPIAAGMAHDMGASTALMTAVIVGGAFFGDNLSFISDTTVVATQTQGVKMSDKFRVNSRIVAPAVAIVLIIYCVMGSGMTIPHATHATSLLKVLPYLAVLVAAVCGMNVMVVLTGGIALCGIIGIATGSYDFFGWLAALGKGMGGMGELIIVAMMAGGMLETIRKNGGIDYLISKLTAHVSGKRGAEMSIGVLVCLVNVCTANNTVAILTVGGIARQLADKYGLDKRKCASILDTFSCATQGLLPYGAQMLLAAGLAKAAPLEIITFLYYPMAIGICAILAILLRLPRKYS